jgi:hypothetical protein
MNHNRIMNYAMKFNAIIPTQGSQCHDLLEAMFDGERFTVLTALKEKKIFAVSQRCTDLRRNGWPVKSEWLTLRGGKRVKQYWLEA